MHFIEHVFEAFIVVGFAIGMGVSVDPSAPVYVILGVYFIAFGLVFIGGSGIKKLENEKFVNKYNRDNQFHLEEFHIESK